MPKEPKKLVQLAWPAPTGHLWEGKAVLREDGLEVEASSPFGPPRADMVGDLAAALYAKVADPAYSFRALVVDVRAVGFFSATYERRTSTLFLACFHDEAGAAAHVKAVQDLLLPHLGPGSRASEVPADRRRS